MTAYRQLAFHVRRCDGTSGPGIWHVSASGSPHPDNPRWVELAGQVFETDPDTASLSMTSRRTPVRMPGGQWRAAAPQAGQWFLNGRVGDLIGFEPSEAPRTVAPADVDRWIDAANARGLAHLWHRDGDAGGARHEVRAHATSGARPASIPARLGVGIDAAWLMAGESGAQVFVIQMLMALVARADIARVVLLSDQGTVPRRLQGLPKVEGMTWADALAEAGPVVDILHRPYQPDDGVDFARYRRVGRCVVLTVLDFIAYDIPHYHESPRAWRRHRSRFDEQIELADGIFAISHAVARRVDSQFAGRLSGPARATALGTDHLANDAGETAVPPALSEVSDRPFLVVLGNDFGHKNRDFAVRVFAELCDRGYEGRLVLAGFHLDLGSSYGYEMAAAGAHAARVARLGAVTAAERNWLLRRAEAVLYPTSAEGFGLIPFEAAALGTPTAFVRFGPLAETLPAVDACDQWRVVLFAGLVERLRREPDRQVTSIRDAAERLTWEGHAATVVEGYRELLAAGPGRQRRSLPGRSRQAWRAASDATARLTAAIARRTVRLLSA